MNELPPGLEDINKEEFPFIKTYAAAEAAHYHKHKIAQSLDQVNSEMAMFYLNLMPTAVATNEDAKPVVA